jgi:DNA-binding MarR family transcriptional regulator
MRNELHIALMELVGLLNSPQNDELLLHEAGVSLDRALFPLLVRVGAMGPIGVVDLACQVGRDHSTVSRQIAKLEAQGLVARAPDGRDQRVRAAVITPEGRRVADQIAAARDRLFARLLDGWSETDRADLTRLNRKLVDRMNDLRRSVQRTSRFT